MFGDEATALATPLVMFRAVMLLEGLLRRTDGWTSMEHPPQLNLIWKIATTKKGTLFIFPSRLLSPLSFSPSSSFFPVHFSPSTGSFLCISVI